MKVYIILKKDNVFINQIKGYFPSDLICIDNMNTMKKYSFNSINCIENVKFEKKENGYIYDLEMCT